MKKQIIFLLLTLPLFLFAQEENPFMVLKKHLLPALNVAFSPDGKYLASCSEDKSVILWSTDKWEIHKVIPFHTFAVKAVSFHYTKDHQYLFTNGEYIIKQWTLNAEPVSTWGGFSTTLWMIDVSPDGRYMTAGSYEKIIHIWDLVIKTEKINPLKGHEKNVLAARFSPDGKQIVTGSLDNTLKLWNWKTGNCIRTYKGHGGNIYDVHFSPVDTTIFASCSEDRGIRIWNKNEEKSIKTITGHDKPIMNFAFSKDGKFIISGSIDKTIKLWELSTNKCIATFDQKDMVNGIALNPDNTIIAAALNDNTVALWKLNISECLVNFYYGKEMQARMDTLPLFKPKGKSENRSSYEQRVSKQIQFKQDLIQTYFLDYMNKTTMPEIPKQ